MKKRRRKKRTDHLDFKYITCDIIKKQKCSSCKKNTIDVMVYRYISRIWKKPIIEICSCNSCLKDYIKNIETLEKTKERDSLLDILKVMSNRFDLINMGK